MQKRASPPLFSSMSMSGKHHWPILFVLLLLGSSSFRLAAPFIVCLEPLYKASNKPFRRPFRVPVRVKKVSPSPPAPFPLLCSLSPPLPSWLAQVLPEQNVTSLTPLQQQTYSLLNDTKDTNNTQTEPLTLLIKSPTGSGKTLAYLLPMLARLDYARRSTQAVVIVPTPGLVMQVTRLIRYLLKGRQEDFNVMPIVDEGRGSRSKTGWILSDPPIVVIGTPKGLSDVLGPGGSGWASKVEHVVVDEVDECERRYGEDLNRVIGRALSRR